MNKIKKVIIFSIILYSFEIVKSSTITEKMQNFIASLKTTAKEGISELGSFIKNPIKTGSIWTSNIKNKLSKSTIFGQSKGTDSSITTDDTSQQQEERVDVTQEKIDGVQKLKDEIESIKKTHLNETKQLEQKLKKEHEEKQKKLNSEKSELKEKLQNQAVLTTTNESLQTYQEEQGKKINDLQMQLQEQTAGLKNNHAKEMQKLQVEYNSHLKNKTSLYEETKKQLNDAKLKHSQYEQQLQNLQQANYNMENYIQNNLARLQQSNSLYQSENERLQSELNNQLQQLNNLKNQHDQLNNQFTELYQNNQQLNIEKSSLSEENKNLFGLTQKHQETINILKEKMEGNEKARLLFEQKILFKKVEKFFLDKIACQMAEKLNISLYNVPNIAKLVKEYYFAAYDFFESLSEYQTTDGWNIEGYNVKQNSSIYTTFQDFILKCNEITPKIFDAFLLAITEHVIDKHKYNQKKDDYWNNNISCIIDELKASKPYNYRFASDAHGSPEFALFFATKNINTINIGLGDYIDRNIVGYDQFSLGNLLIAILLSAYDPDTFIAIRGNHEAFCTGLGAGKLYNNLKTWYMGITKNMDQCMYYLLPSALIINGQSKIIIGSHSVWGDETAYFTDSLKSCKKHVNYSYYNIKHNENITKLPDTYEDNVKGFDTRFTNSNPFDAIISAWCDYNQSSSDDINYYSGRYKINKNFHEKALSSMLNDQNKKIFNIYGHDNSNELKKLCESKFKNGLKNPILIQNDYKDGYHVENFDDYIKQKNVITTMLPCFSFNKYTANNKTFPKQGSIFYEMNQISNNIETKTISDIINGK